MLVKDGAHLTEDGYLAGTEGRPAVPHTMGGTPVEDVSSPAQIAYGLILAGYRDLDVFNYMRARYAEVPSGYMYFTTEVTMGWCVKHRRTLIDNKVLTMAQYGRAAIN